MHVLLMGARLDVYGWVKLSSGGGGLHAYYLLSHANKFSARPIGFYSITITGT
jgi:hypothetical protein